MDKWKEFLKPADWEIVTRAPGNFFLAGEHAVMFGHPAIVQAFPHYFYVGVRRRLDDRNVHIDTNNVFFVDHLNPKRKNRSFAIPTNMIACQLEHLLSVNGWNGVDIGLYSELHSMCGLASSGALGAALSLALNYLFEQEGSRNTLDDFLKKVSNPTRRLDEVIHDPMFSKALFPLAWCIDSLFHNHQSSGANAFFSLIGSPDGLPAFYRQTTPRKGDVDNPIEGFNPSGTISKGSTCPEFAFPPPQNGKCSKGNPCPDYATEMSYYSRFPYEAKSLSDDYPNAFCELFHFCCALIYSGRPKITPLAIKSVKKRIAQFGKYFAQCDYLSLGDSSAFDVTMGYIGFRSEELWQAMGAYFRTADKPESKSMVQKIGFVQSGLKNLLGISTEEIDSICQKAQLKGFEAKLTGGGKGGDVVVFCDGDNWNKLVEFQNEITEGEDSLARVHFSGRWFARKLTCIPSIVKPGAHRFLAALDIINSKVFRVEGSDLFEQFSACVDKLADALEGKVCSYRVKDDQRVIAFKTREKAEEFISGLCKTLRNDLQVEIRHAINETPFDWAELTELEVTPEQSKCFSDVIHKMEAGRGTRGCM